MAAYYFPSRKRKRKPCPVCGRTDCWQHRAQMLRQYGHKPAVEDPPRKRFNPDFLRKDIWDADMARDD
jgi:hypothetical protein